MAAATAKDPFNWPMPKREDLMSLNTINPDKDLARAKTAAATMRMRSTSQNLETTDIRGKFETLVFVFSTWSPRSLNP